MLQVGRSTVAHDGQGYCQHTPHAVSENMSVYHSCIFVYLFIDVCSGEWNASFCLDCIPGVKLPYPYDVVVTYL